MKEKTVNILEWAFIGVGVAMFAYHMFSTQYMLFGSYEHQNAHLSFLLILIFMGTMRIHKKRWVWSKQIVLIILSLVATIYVFVNLEHLEEIVGFPNIVDQVMGIILIVLVVEATRQAWGLTLPIVVVLFVAYFFFGHYMGGPLEHRCFSTDYIISYLCIGLSGIYGTFLSISANYIFLFVVFGALLEITKINDLFFELGKGAGKVLQGGPAHTAVISSSMVGMVSGAAVANVAITGAFTIPYMKRVGYRPELAGAIEATASTGGQLMPPIMGASAFLMAFFLGVPYVEVMLAGILPAVFFYMAVAIGVQLIAVSHGIKAPKEKADTKLIWRRLPLFVIPMLIIIILLLLRYSPMYAAFWAIITAVGLSCIMKETRPKFSQLITVLARGSLIGAKIGASLAAVGLMAQTLITTGLGNKIAGLVQSLSGGVLIIALIITMLASILLGCGCPTTAAYSLVAIVVVPALIRMGVLPFSAHFFAFYFAIISALTPPVALAALAGAGIAEANYFRTAMNSFKLAIAGFIIPYLVIYSPILILHLEKSWLWALGSLICITLGLAVLSALIYNCGLTKFSLGERLIGFATLVLMMLYYISRQLPQIGKEEVFLFLGTAGFIVLLISQIRHKKRALQFESS
jgi:TRAP transporter 4TM/12TM fusion protein